MDSEPLHPAGFTAKSPGILLILQTDIFISEAYDPASGTPEPVRHKGVAIWDTGATGTVISKSIVDALHLQPSGKTRCKAVGAGDQPHEYISDTYFTNVYLPNQVVIVGQRVTVGSVAGADVLIGMDIISRGDFSITNLKGKTCWSFRMPSMKEIDYVKEIEDYHQGLRIFNRSREEERRRRQMMKRK